MCKWIEQINKQMFGVGNKKMSEWIDCYDLVVEVCVVLSGRCQNHKIQTSCDN